MDITEHIEVGRSDEKVFSWMLQPQHIVQLITLDLTKDTTAEAEKAGLPQSFEDDEVVDSHGSWRLYNHKRWQEQAETVIGIEDLSTPTLQIGTTFRYTVGIKNHSEEFPPWRLLHEGTITIKKISPFQLFSFSVTGNGIISAYECQLTFQPQSENTRITYYRSYRFVGKVLRMGARALLSPLLRPRLSKGFFDRYQRVVMKHQLELLKSQMEDEIDQEAKE